jgi:hypothetical protein
MAPSAGRGTMRNTERMHNLYRLLDLGYRNTPGETHGSRIATLFVGRDHGEGSRIVGLGTGKSMEEAAGKCLSDFRQRLTTLLGGPESGEEI